MLDREPDLQKSNLAPWRATKPHQPLLLLIEKSTIGLKCLNAAFDRGVEIAQLILSLESKKANERPCNVSIMAGYWQVWCPDAAPKR